MPSRPDRAALYRAKAHECMRLAQAAATQSARTQYTDLAAHWHALATAADFQEAEPATVGSTTASGAKK